MVCIVTSLSLKFYVVMYVLQEGESPLWVASFYNHLNCVQLLLEGGASVDVQKGVSVTIAVCMSQRELVLELPPGYFLVVSVVLVH